MRHAQADQPERHARWALQSNTFLDQFPGSTGVLRCVAAQSAACSGSWSGFGTRAKIAARAHSMPIRLPTETIDTVAPSAAARVRRGRYGLATQAQARGRQAERESHRQLSRPITRIWAKSEPRSPANRVKVHIPANRQRLFRVSVTADSVSS